MPATPTAARISPFSSDMKPITWVSALRRVIIISRPISTTDSASARSSRVSAPRLSVVGSTTMIDSATSPTPSAIEGNTPSAVSMERWMRSRRTMLCSASGIATPFAPSAISAVTYRCGAPCDQPCHAAAAASTQAWAA